MHGTATSLNARSAPNRWTACWWIRAPHFSRYRATGVTVGRIFGYVLLTMEGRSAPFEVLEMPGSEAVLLGVLPFEALGLELDLKNQRVIVLPDDGPDTYIMAL